MRLPDFLVIGARQGGATPLVEYLRREPGVFVAAGDDGIRFFTHEWERGLSWYSSWFDAARPEQVVGERSNFYTRFPLAPEAPSRAAQVVPGARLLYVIRHPIDRIEAHYLSNRADWERAPIDEAVLAQPDEYVAPSRYATQIERWLDHFPKEQLLVLTDDELKADPEATVARAVRFVGAEPAAGRRHADGADPFAAPDHRVPGPALRRLRQQPFVASLRRRLPAGVRRQLRRPLSRPLAAPVRELRLAPDTRERIIAELAPELERLRSYLGPSFDGWGLVSPS
jgi:hypothetical protein